MILKLLEEIMNMERGGQGNEYEDMVREETIKEVIQIIKKYIN